MKLHRIVAIIYQELYITKNSLEVIIDLFYTTIINIVIFGFVSLYLAGSNALAAKHILIGMALWEIVRVTQYTISTGTLWNVWSRNLSNIFVAPISLAEYLIAGMISGVVKSIITMIIVSLLCVFVFNFNIFSVGLLNLLLFFINLSIFAWIVGIFVLALIFRYGTRIQALAWGFIFIFQPLTASFIPVKVLPEILQKFAYILPPTYVFEAARANILNTTTNWQYAGIAFFLNCIYLIFMIVFFQKMFEQSRITGQFARNEG